MDYLYYLYYASDIIELAKDYVGLYQRYVWIGLLVIAVLNCFFGYHLRKLWGILAGFAIGAAISAGTCIYLEKTGTILYLITIIGAFTLGLLALLLYKVGLFFVGALTLPLVLSRAFPTEKMETLLLWMVLGVLVGILTLVWERAAISFITSIGGGFGTAACILTLRNHHSIVMLFMIGLGLSLAGILVQFQPWRSRSDWNSDEERARDKQRHNRRMKRIRRKQKQQEKAEQKKAARSRQADPQTATRKSRTTGNILQRKPAHRVETSEYTPYTAHPLYQATLTRKHIEDEDPQAMHRDMPAASVSGSMAYPNAAPPMGGTRVPHATLDPVQRSASPDLSDVRQQISQEVSDIYEERQQYMDASLNQLLEREFHHSRNSLQGTGGSRSRIKED